MYGTGGYGGLGGMSSYGGYGGIGSSYGSAYGGYGSRLGIHLSTKVASLVRQDLMQKETVMNHLIPITPINVHRQTLVLF